MFMGIEKVVKERRRLLFKKKSSLGFEYLWLNGIEKSPSYSLKL